MPLVDIAALDDERLDVYARLTEAQLRNKLEPEKGVFIAESGKVIQRAFESNMKPLSLLTEAKWLPSLRPLINRIEAVHPEIPIFVAPHSKLEQLTGFELTRGALAAFRRPTLRNIADITTNAHRIAVLEDITNHTNIGAIFRCAAALGLDAVLVTPSCYDPLYRRAVRVSMGTVFQIPWTRIGSETDARATGKSTWAETGIPLLHRLGFKTVAMALSSRSVSLSDPHLAAEDKLAIVLGTEGDGLARETIAQCDYTVRIPMAYGVDSLNVAAAAAVAFWELCTRPTSNNPCRK